MRNAERAKALLQQDGALTCVLCKGEEIYQSKEKGIAPMMHFLDAQTPLCGFGAADRIVGKAAAMLFALAGVEELFAEVITPDAIRILERYGIAYSYATLTERIINRAGTGICPMEMAVEAIEEPAQAREAIRQTMQALKKQH